eukprot:GHRR01018071.1.p1 GENE.GHRR01018071.1~~GHRR01018071.1.p1  ORF type:complete len:174 (-),score=44.03 GHRR01018071.1:608-1129(-)
MQTTAWTFALVCGALLTPSTLQHGTQPIEQPFGNAAETGTLWPGIPEQTLCAVNCNTLVCFPAMQIAAGAEVILTQPPLDWPTFQSWMADAHRRSLPTATRLLVGFPCLSSAANTAFWLALCRGAGNIQVSCKALLALKCLLTVQLAMHLLVRLLLYDRMLISSVSVVNHEVC